jgi:hypothetical protein
MSDILKDEKLAKKLKQHPIYPIYKDLCKNCQVNTYTNIAEEVQPKHKDLGMRNFLRAVNYTLNVDADGFIKFD